MSDAKNNMSGICCHCSNGIPYDKVYFLCVWCDLTFCTSCSPAHPAIHKPALRRSKDTMIARGSPPTKHRCEFCQRTIGGECMKCNGCEVKVCFSCFSDNIERFEGHDHKSFTFVRIPDAYVLPEFEPECTSCLLGSTLAHCSRCLEGIMEGERSYECIDCTRIYGDAQSICESCLPFRKQEHIKGHAWLSVMFREVKNVDGGYCAGRCGTCLEGTDVTHETKVSHPHKNFIIEMGPLERERRTNRMYRNCPRHQVRQVPNVDYQPDTNNPDFGCQCCYKRFANGAKIYSCMQCDFTCCRGCQDGGISHHPHPQVAAYIKSTTPSEEMWHDLVPGGPGRRACDICKEEILPDLSPHFRCRQCVDFDICEKCFSSTDKKFTSFISISHRCGTSPEMTYFEPKVMSQEWNDEQAATLHAFVAAQKADDEQNRQHILELSSPDDCEQWRNLYTQVVEEDRAEKHAKAKAEAEAAREQEMEKLEAAKKAAEVLRDSECEAAKKLSLKQLGAAFDAACNRRNASVAAAKEEQSVAFKQIAQRERLICGVADKRAAEQLENLALYLAEADAKDEAERAAKAKREREERQAELERAKAATKSWDECVRNMEGLNRASESLRTFDPRTLGTLAVPANSPLRNRAPSPSPAVNRLAPPAATQPRRPRSSNNLGGLLKGALKLTNAVLQMENAANGGGGGGGFVGTNNNVGGGMDMSSLWGPLNSAASMPIQ